VPEWLNGAVSFASANPMSRKNRCGGAKINKGYIYVLRCKDQKFYIGSTRDLCKRLKAHEMGRVKTTKSRRPVKLIYKEELEDYKEARKRELYLKSGTGRDWLRTTLEGCQSG
jgi:putative endonuclease